MEDHEDEQGRLVPNCYRLVRFGGVHYTHHTITGEFQELVPQLAGLFDMEEDSDGYQFVFIPDADGNEHETWLPDPDWQYQVYQKDGRRFVSTKGSYDVAMPWERFAASHSRLDVGTKAPGHSDV